MVATTLRRGQIAIIQVNSEDSDDPHIPGVQNMNRDSISFVLLAGIGSGTQIHFTDRTWTSSGSLLNGGSFSNSGTDGTFTFTATADLAAGTVITISTLELGNAGINIADTGEAIYVYQGTAAVPTGFLFAIETGDANNVFNASLTNTGLTAGVDAIGIGADNISFGERIHNQQAAVTYSDIANVTNWNTNDNSPQTNHGATSTDTNVNLNVAPDIQIWMAGISGGHGLFSVSGDATQNGGLGYNGQSYFQNTANDGNALTTTNRFWSPTHILFDTVAGKFFIVDSSGTFDRVLQGNISDLLTNPGVAPPMTILWSDKPAVSDGDGVTSIQLDKVNGDVYFTADNKLHRVDYNTADQTAVTLADLGNDTDSGNKNFANELVLDLVNGRAFIVSTETFNDFVESPPGSGIIIVATTTYQNSIHMVENIAPGDTNATGNTITELQWSGIYDESLNSASGLPDPGNFEDFYGKITDVDINTLTGEIWFTTVQLNAGQNGETAGIFKATRVGANLTVTQIYSETNATNTNFTHIQIDEETGFYYVTSIEPGESGQHALFRGLLSSAPGTAPTKFADVGNINDMTPRDMSIESAPTLTGSAIGGLALTEASSAANSAETARVFLFSGLTAGDIDTPAGDELAGALVRVSNGFTSESSTVAGHAVTVDFLRINSTTSGTIAGSGITYNYNSATGVMTLSGPGTVAEYAAALALVQFSTSGDNVTNDGFAPTRTVAASVFDGLLYSDEITNIVTVTGINDAPVNTPGAAMNFTEDTTGTAGIPTPPPAPVNAVTGISVADADADPATHDITVTLSVAHGILNIRTDVVGGLAAGEVTGNGTATLVLTGTQNQINATLAAVNNVAGANGLVYTPAADYNGADTLTIVTNDAGFSGNDPGNSGTGTTEADTDTKTINIADVNDAPSVGGDGTEASPTILEDQPFTNLTAPSVATLFGGQFSDALDVQFHAVNNPTGSAGDTFAGIAITANGSNANGQWQYWDGDSWENIGAASVDAAKTLTAATLVRFSPTLNFNGAAPTLTVRLIETGGPAIVNAGTVDLNPAPPTTGPTAVYSATSVTLSQDITPVNDVPTSANLLGDTVTHLEGAAVTQLDLGGNATIGDVDSANFDGGSLTVALSGSLAEDQLVISAVGGVTSTPTTVSVGGTQIATYTGGANGAPLVFTFDADATPAAVQALVRAIGYSNSAGDNPTDGDRTVTWTLVDGDGVLNGGVDTLVLTSTLDVDPVNDPPAGIDGSVLINEDAVHTFTAANFAFTDPENHALSQVRITTLPGNGVITLNNVAIIAGADINVADITAGNLKYTPDANENGTPHDSFTFQVRDAGGTLDGGVNLDASANTFTFNLTAINDAPVNSVPLATQTFNEDNTLTFSAANANLISVGDVDGGVGDVRVMLAIETGSLTLNPAATGALTSFTGDGTNNVELIGTVAEVNAALNGLVYNPGANYNGDRTLTITTNDLGNSGTDPGLTGTLTSEEDQDTISVDVTAVNDAPTVIGDGTEEAAPIIEDTPGAGQSVSDLFGGQYSDAADAQFSVGNPGGSAPGSFGGIAVTANGSSVATGQWQYFDGAIWVDIGAASDASAKLFDPSTLIRFNPALDFTGAAPTLTVHLIDNSAPAFNDGDTANLTVTGGTTPYSTGTVVLSQNVIAANAAPVVDLDANDSSGATGGDFASAYTEDGAAAAVADTDVTITDADPGDMVEGATITVTDSLAGDQLTLSAALPGTITVLSGLGTDTLVLTGSASAADYQAALALVRYSSTSNDPTDGGTDGERTVTVTVTDGSSNSVARTATVTITATNDAPAGTDNTISVAEDGSVALHAANFDFTDPDGGDAMSAVIITSVTGGKLFFDADGAGGADPVEVTVFPTAEYSVADLALGKLTFEPNANLNGSGAGSIGFQVVDDSGEPNDTDLSANTLTIDVTAVNDSPVVPDSPDAAVNEGSTAFIVPTLAVSDVDLDARNGGAGDYGGASFTMNRSGGANAQDQFILQNGTNFTVTGTILTGGDLQAGGLTFGNWAWDNAGTLTINFTSSATIATSALVDEVLQAIQYNIADDTPPASVDLDYALNDGSPGGGQGAGATATDGGTVTVNITATNDGPFIDLLDPGAGTDSTISYTENDAATALAPTANVFDPDLTDFAGGVLTVQFNSGGTADDRLTILNAGQISTSANTILFGGATPIATFTGGTNGTTPLVITFNANANAAEVDAVLRSIAYSNVSDSPSGADRVIGFVLTDGDGGTSNLATATVDFTAVEDPALAVADANDVDEDGLIVGASVLGNDSDPDGPALTVTEVNGSAADVDDEIILASGAKLTLRADGTYDYNPNDQFNTLTDTSSGAVNTSDTDTFSYTLANGNTVSVTITINGVISPEDLLFGDGTNNVITGPATNDTFLMMDGGDDTVTGNGGDDYFFFGATLTGADSVDGGADNSLVTGIGDTLALRGDYNMTLGAGQLTGIERLVLRSGTPGGGSPVDYTLSTSDGAVAAGTTLNVIGTTLTTAEQLIFNGSAETNGHFVIVGGAASDILVGGQLADNISGGLGNDFLYGRGGDDVLFGGLGADHLRGGMGEDVFHYDDVNQSNALSMDTIEDFQTIDRINLSAIDANNNGGDGNTQFTFIGSNAFSNTAGELRATESGGVWTIEGDTNGDGAADLVIAVNTVDPVPITAEDFYL